MIDSALCRQRDKETVLNDRGNGVAFLFGSPSLWRVMQSDVSERIIFVKQQIAETGLTNANCILQHRFKNGLQIAGRD